MLVLTVRTIQVETRRITLFCTQISSFLKKNLRVLRIVVTRHQTSPQIEKFIMHQLQKKIIISWEGSHGPYYAYLSLILVIEADRI